jgi:aminopeptidase N
VPRSSINCCGFSARSIAGKNASIDDFEKLATKVHGENLRYFFARWVESTGVPEFSSDYLIIRTRGGKFVARGTIKQNYDNLKLPVEVQLRSEGENGLKIETVQMDESTADFNIESTGKPLTVIIDPNYKLLRISPDLRVSSIARRGIERFKEGSYAEAQAQFEEALKLDRFELVDLLSSRSAVPRAEKLRSRDR